MSLFAFSCFFTAFLTAVLGLFVFSQNPRGRLNQTWFLTSVSFFIWIIGLGGVVVSSNKEYALFFQKILYIGTILIPIFFLHFCITLLNRDNKIKEKIILVVGYILSILFILLSFTKYFIVSVGEKTYFNYWPVQTGSLYWLFLAYFFICVIYTFISLKTNNSKLDIVSRQQIKFVYYAALVGFTGGSTNFLLDFNLNIYPIGNYFVMFYVAFMTYAIVKHRLFDIKIFTTELLTFAIWIFLVVQTFLSNTRTELILNVGLLFLVIVFGVLLIKSVFREVEQREKIQALALDLSKANNRLKELDQMKTEFISLATHQIRAPLTAIKGYISMIFDGDYGPVSDDVLKTLDIIQQSTNNLVTIVGDFLDVSRIEQGRMKYDFKTFDLKKLVDLVVQEYKPNIEKRGLAVSYSVDEGKDYTVFADEGKVKQVVGNIVDNSIKYTPKGHINITLKRESNDKFLVEVNDTGVGIDPKVMPKLFQKFSRAANANEVNILGTGLGLYVAKQMMQAHQGNVWAESQGAGRGSQFYIELPVRSSIPQNAA